MHKVTIEAQAFKNRPFKAPLLSELLIELPKPQSPPRSPHQNIEVHNYGDYQYCSAAEEELHVRDARAGSRDSPLNLKADSNSWFGGSSKTKNSSSAATCRSEVEIIMEWVRSLFQKRNLLGFHWEDAFQGKRIDLMQWAFTRLKEQEQVSQECYLKTQSHCKPQLNKCNKIVSIGIDNYVKTVNQVTLKLKREGFSRILRFLIFQQGSQSSRLKHSRQYRPEASGTKSGQRRLLCSKGGKLMPRHEPEAYHVNKKKPEYAMAPVNQYSLAPVSPRRQNQLTQSKETEMTDSMSPNQRVKNQQFYHLHQMQMTQSGRPGNGVRPHSHNPILSHSGSLPHDRPQQQPKTRPVEEDNREIRAASANPNIKIAVVGSASSTLPNDYEAYCQEQREKIHRLGTAENKRMRQNYQVNALGNELIPQDIVASPCHNYSTPNSPRPQQPQRLQVSFGPLSPRPQFGRHSYMPVRPDPPRQMRQSGQVQPEHNRRPTRDKLVVMSARR